MNPLVRLFYFLGWGCAHCVTCGFHEAAHRFPELQFEGDDRPCELFVKRKAKK